MQTRNLNIKQRSRSAAGVSITVMLTMALLSIIIDTASGRPDVRQSPFSLELQPPLLETATEDAAFNTANGDRAIDSYGNPIDALRPIDTPDGRKVVSAQGVQFEIPTYASGITEIRKPADDLLPPHIDVIAVAQPNTDIDSTDSTSFAPAPATSLTPPKHESPTTTTDVEVEKAQLVPLHEQQQQQQEESAQTPQLTSGILPEYLLELQKQDPNIGGPVPWTPQPNGAPLSVIAWDLLPPFETVAEPETEPQIITEQQPTRHVVGVEQPKSHNIRVSVTSGQALLPVVPVPLTTGQVTVVPLVRDGPDAHGTNAHIGSTTQRNGGRFPNRQRGNVHYSTTSTTLRPRTSSTTPSTTTTTRATTPSTTTATTTTTTTTPWSRSTASTSISSTTPLDPSTFYKLENEENYAYTLPPWLQEVTDPDLDVAVTFIVPTDNDQYNHTLAGDLEPPLEPFVDLRNIQLTPPPTKPTVGTTTSTTTATTTTTTKRPSTQAPVHTTRTTKAPTHRAPTTQKVQESHQPQLIKNTIHTAPPKASEATTTTPPGLPDVESNPFDSATLPPWLRDFDYPDVGPGVPYNPDNFKDSATGSGVQQSGGSKPNDFQPHGFDSRIQFQVSTTTTQSPTTSPPAVTTFSAFPSQVSLPLPASSSQQFVGTDLNTVEPPLVLIPPVVNNDEPSPSQPIAFSTNLSQNPTTNSITHFPARLDGTVSGEETVNPTQPPHNQVEKTLTPFNANANAAADNPKIEYTKSDEGKVISAPVSTQRKDAQNNSVFPHTPPSVSAVSAPTVSNTGKYTGGFGAPAGLLRPQIATKPDIYVAGNEHEFSTRIKARPGVNAGAASGNVDSGRYSGGFGAPGGVLSPQNAPRPFQQAQHTQSTSQLHHQQSQQQTATPEANKAASAQYQNRFGGPPGILVPFDNVQRTGQQQ